MHKVRSLGVLSVAKMMGAIYTLLGLALIPVFLLEGRLGSTVIGRDNPFGALDPLAFGIMAPIFYGVLGFVGGALMVLLYNLIAKWLGGIEVQIQATNSVAPPLA
jgi:hypothetical protein